MLAGASLSERLTQNSATTETAPEAMKKPRLPNVGVIQPNGATTMPNTSVPANCAVLSTISGVVRSKRVINSVAANAMLPASAIIAGQLTLCAEGCNAITTPQKPIKIALQRRQPTCSRSRTADNAVTKIGVV